MKYIFSLSLLPILLFAGCSVVTIKQQEETYKKPTNQNKPANIETLYQSCSGHHFEATCQDGNCIEQGLEQRVFNLWKTWFQEKHEINDGYFDSHFDIANVATEGEPPHFWWRVDYIFHIDWVRSREAESINLAFFNEFSSIDEPTDEQIKDQIKAYALPHKRTRVNSVITRKQLEPLLQKTYMGVPITYDFCHIGIGDDFHGNGVNVRGTGIIDEDANRCVGGNIDLMKGTVNFEETPCWIN